MTTPSSFDALTDCIDKSARLRTEQMNALLREAQHMNRSFSSVRKEARFLSAAVALSILLAFATINIWAFPSVVKVASVVHGDMDHATKTLVARIDRLHAAITQR